MVRMLTFPCTEYKVHMYFISVGELRTCMLHGVAKIKKQTKKKKKEKRKLISGSKTKERKRFQDILRHENLLSCRLFS